MGKDVGTEKASCCTTSKPDPKAAPKPDPKAAPKSDPKVSKEIPSKKK